MPSMKNLQIEGNSFTFMYHWDRGNSL